MFTYLTLHTSLGDRGNKINGRTPSAENLTNLDHLPPPPVYREATRLSKEDIRNNIQENATADIQIKSKNGGITEHRNNGEPNTDIDHDDVPPPIPPHRTPVDRPKSAMSIDQPTRLEHNFRG